MKLIDKMVLKIWNIFTSAERIWLFFVYINQAFFYYFSLDDDIRRR